MTIEGGDLERDGFCLSKNVLNNGNVKIYFSTKMQKYIVAQLYIVICVKRK